MRGKNIINKYIINSTEYLYGELTSAQRDYIKPFIDTKKYDEFRNKILFEEGDDFEGVINIHFPSLKMECFDEYGVLLN
jgi:hypothetical protein